MLVFASGTLMTGRASQRKCDFAIVKCSKLEPTNLRIITPNYNVFSTKKAAPQCRLINSYFDSLLFVISTELSEWRNLTGQRRYRHHP